MKMKNLALAILFLLPLLSSGQPFSQFITNDTVLNIICRKQAKFDSLVVYNQSSFWTPNIRLKGVAFEGVNKYLICIEFSFPLTAKNNKHPYFKKELIDYALPALIENNDFSYWSQDSIVVDSCIGLKLRAWMSDGPTSAIIKLYPKQMKYVYLQGENVAMNQRQCPNGDREGFIELFEVLSKLLPIEDVCEQKRDFFIIEP